MSHTQVSDHPRVMLWFREDLRLSDHPALHVAANLGQVFPVFHWDGIRGPLWFGAAARWWLQKSLAGLDASLQNLGSSLHLSRGVTEVELPRLAKSLGVTHVIAHEAYDPVGIQEERLLAQALQVQGVRLQLEAGNTLSPVKAMRTGAGTPFRVFTPYWHAVRDMDFGCPLVVPKVHWIPSGERPQSVAMEELGLLDSLNWWRKWDAMWTPGEQGARKTLHKFLVGEPGVHGYAERRELPAIEGTSRLSPHLRFGEISPRQIWWASIQENAKWAGAAGLPSFLRQLFWRDFSRHILVHFPHTREEPFHPEFSAFPWSGEPGQTFAAWKRGRTGYPLVDAAMKQLWQTGWMHNRARMVVASFLCKHLLMDWRLGRDWFHDCLLDGEPANNGFGWQWSAGCGADGAPFFRIFNPQLQREKFDPHDEYCKVWDPQPTAQVVVSHTEARNRALVAYQTMRSKAAH